jgi:thioredoxin-like negative regulator of GroEL
MTTILCFGARWVPVWPLLTARLDELVAARSPRLAPVTVEAVDVDADPARTAEYAISVLPALVIVDDAGTVVTRLVGALDRDDLARILSVI